MKNICALYKVPVYYKITITVFDKLFNANCP